MTAEEKMNELGGQAFHARFINALQPPDREPKLAWLGFGRKNSGRLAIEANVVHSCVRISFNFSLAAGRSACCINLRAKTDVFDGNNYATYRDRFIDTIHAALARAPAPHAGIRLAGGDAYFKPFGALRNTHQTDVFFDAANTALAAAVEPCAVVAGFDQISLAQALGLTLAWLEA